MTYNFCTLFDKNYLLKGLTLHYSLEKYVANFKLWILCMDDAAFDLLSKLNLPKVILIKLADFENEELKKIKSGRKKSEYCWTCTPFLPSFILRQNPELETIAYLDADLFFFDSPKNVYDEFRGNSIMIIPHNFSDDQKWRENISGTYNVSMLIFRNDPNASECLIWWQEKVLEWCFDYPDSGRLGDQAYLNDWPKRFKGVCVLKNEGANLASWNIKKYELTTSDKKIIVSDKKTKKSWGLIFYHFHGTNLHRLWKKIKIRDESLSLDSTGAIFSLYSKTLTKVFGAILNKDQKFSAGINSGLKYLKWFIKKTVLQKLKNMVAFLQR